MYILNKNEEIAKQKLQNKTFNSVYDAVFKNRKNGNLFFNIKNNNRILNRFDNSEIKQKNTSSNIKYIPFADTIITVSKENINFSDILFFSNFETKFGEIFLFSNHTESVYKTTQNGCLLIKDSDESGKGYIKYQLGIVSPTKTELLNLETATEKQIIELESATAAYYIQKYGLKIKQK